MEILEGYVDHIRFRNEENGYTVLSLDAAGEEETCIGNFTYISEGEYLRLEGEYVDHQIHGPQFKVEQFTVKEPEETKDMERYLGSGAIKGIGPVIAKRITKKFKKDSFRIIEEEPERLVEIKGISEKIARQIAEQFAEKREMRDAMIYLDQYGIATNYAVKIYNEYGNDLYDIVKKNPYQLAEDIQGIGFKIADEIAAHVGIGNDSEFRIKAGVLYTLLQASNSGHVYFPKQRLIERTSELLNIRLEEIDNQLMDLMIEKKLIMKDINGVEAVYTSYLYYTELNTARRLLDLNIDYQISKEEFEKNLARLAMKAEVQLDILQENAVQAAAESGVLIITGGPGTGKTTTINAIIQYFELEGMDLLLAAPTGRAAKRMTETTGYQAQTIHRLLELNGAMDGDSRYQFERNEQNPLEADVVIIDEVSMVDISLMHSLLEAIVPGTRLILVGDVNQLPSVGPGNVLKDIIASKLFSVVELTKIFRQDADSHIVLNAHKVNRGESISLDNKSKDFFMLQREEVKEIIGVLVYLVRDKMPNYVNATSYDIQVLTPMRKGELGVEKLNQVLQEYLNPPSDQKQEKEVRFGVFREGDKVMQIKNNYKLEWEISNQKGFVLDSGVGVFNGDMGVIREINTFSEQVTVIFDDARVVHYSYSMLDELELSYAITIHKAQGSEYPSIVMPLLSGPRVLFNRNLLYTAITRAKKCVTIVGRAQMVDMMINNTEEQHRHSGLTYHLKD